ncbi:lysophospholipid acyltransferase family protein [Mycolicibacterium neworleansense]|uniref:Phospholipid/glycerol acyltransferase n=1 Tax=Mycolicibacterium neworleansense TaxID=146018 RepID=A0A0H5RVI6_9MYCO|nr:lysophospholipid acyltransferase family protein [Mycolicibacterium neworleansense]MCV7360828.1 acyltransferase family protein [Mycolicibacterium neworleansense]CRZ18165.1 phospholipid/glycerol acyltransferase [Mycolicibacterium neworleansense]
MSVTKIDEIMNQPSHVQTLRRAVEAVADGVDPLVNLYRPYVDGLENLPRDGRFLLVGNHTQFGTETLLIPYVVRREIGMRVRPLTDRRFGDMPRPVSDVMAACGAVVGSPEGAGELMAHDEPVMVFPGGGREIGKFKGEQYKLRWEGRAGFARVAIEHGYPIVPVALVGGDDVYVGVTTRDHWLGRLSQSIGEKLTGQRDMAVPLVRGIGPTLIPRPQRMYLRFAEPIGTAKPARTTDARWVATVKERTQESLEQSLGGLLTLRAEDPYRELNPLAWRNATRSG